MQPNLKSYYADSLEFSATLPLPSNLVSKIQDASQTDEDGDSVFLDSYKSHRALAVVIGINREDTSNFKVRFAY